MPRQICMELWVVGMDGITTDNDNREQDQRCIHMFGLLVPEIVKTNPIWSDIGPQSGQRKYKKTVFPKMTSTSLETVRIASGSPRNLFSY